MSMLTPTILAVPLGLALGLTGWSPTAPLASAPVMAAQLWQKPASATPARRRKETNDDGQPAKGTARGASTATAGTGTATSAPAAKKRRPASPSGGAARPASKSTEALEAEVFGGGAPGVHRKPARHRAHPARRDAADAEDDAEASDDGDDEEEEEDDDDDSAWAASLPVIAPRIVSLGVATALIGRSFRFDAPLQPENTFPRTGIAADLEAYPLMSLRGWARGVGLGGSFATELGSAGIDQADGGRLSYPVTERRWDASLRYAAALGEHLVLVPFAGYGQSSYEVQRKTTLAPSACASGSAQVCLPAIHLSHLAFGAAARVAFSSSVGLSLSGAYLLGFGLGKGTGELGSEAASTSARGLSAELALAWQVKDWLAIRIAAPFTRYAYAFSGSGLPYHAATETYYGGVLGATIFTR